MSFFILQGDARQIPLPADSVDAVITSVPYYGLRDYGTARWEGGSAECEHIVGGQVQDNKYPGSITAGPYSGCDASHCKRCGAIRIDKQIGLEPSIKEYLDDLRTVFSEVKRALKPHGVMWINMGDSYSGSWGNYHPNSPPGKHGQRLKETARWNRPAYNSQDFIPPTAKLQEGLKPKDLMMMPARLALALQADGWYLRSQIPWIKRNPMPESTEDRPTSAVEYIFLLAKSERYFYDSVAVQLPAVAGANGSSFTKGKTAHGKHNLGQGARNDSSTRNRRNSDWFFESWQGLLSNEGGKPLAFVVNTHGFPGAHFATFPPKLIEPMILASTSEKGVCSACGKPWVRVVEKERSFQSGSGRSGNMPVGKNGAGLQGGGETLDVRRGPCVTSNTTGWHASCQCNAPTRPAIVFDPFGGSGTVALVASRLGRNSVIMDLSQEYCRMAKKRVTEDAPLLAHVDTHKPAPTEEQGALW